MLKLKANHIIQHFMKKGMPAKSKQTPKQRAEVMMTVMTSKGLYASYEQILGLGV